MLQRLNDTSLQCDLFDFVSNIGRINKTKRNVICSVQAVMLLSKPLFIRAFTEHIKNRTYFLQYRTLVHVTHP